VIAIAALVLTLNPWPQHDNPAFPQAVHHKLLVHGAPNTAAPLRGSIDDGWMVAFCTAKLCAPGRVDLTIPQSGVATVDVEAIRLGTDGNLNAMLSVDANGVRVSVAVRLRPPKNPPTKQ